MKNIQTFIRYYFKNKDKKYVVYMVDNDGDRYFLHPDRDFYVDLPFEYDLYSLCCILERINQSNENYKLYFTFIEEVNKD